MRRGEADHVVIVKVKKASGKVSYNDYASHAAADKALKHEGVSFYWKEYGHMWRFRYRVNIYLKG